MPEAPEPSAPEAQVAAARLPDSEIAKCVQGSPAYQVTKWDRAIADAATEKERARVHQIFRDQRVRIRQQVRQEALDAAAGLVRIAKRSRDRGHISNAQLDQAEDEWNTFKEAKNG